MRTLDARMFSIRFASATPFFALDRDTERASEIGKARGCARACAASAPAVAASFDLCARPLLVRPKYHLKCNSNYCHTPHSGEGVRGARRSDVWHSELPQRSESEIYQACVSV